MIIFAINSLIYLFFRLLSFLISQAEGSMTVALGEGCCHHGELSIVYCSRCTVFYIFTLRSHETVVIVESEGAKPK